MGLNRDALEAQVEALATGQEHRALVEACRTLASEIDALSEFDESVWKEYRLALKALREAMSHGGDSSFDNLAAKLRGAEVSDPADA